MADATVLGIIPPHTVRIEYDDSYQDWPFECVDVLGDRVVISALHSATQFYPPPRFPDQGLRAVRRPVLHYPYEHAQEQPDGSWRFLGGDHPEFFIREGPALAPAVDTFGPQYL